MSTVDATGLLRPGLLEDVALLVAGAAVDAPSQTLGAAVIEACVALGGRARGCEPDPIDEAAIDAAVETTIAEVGRIDALVVDAAALFAAGSGQGGNASHGGEASKGDQASQSSHAALRNCLDSSWNVTRAVVNHAFLPGAHGGRIFYLAPAPDAGELAETARAGLENLSRTLATEWARHDVKVLTVAPGEDTAASEVAALCAYLASPAGAYFSGCLLDLRGV